MELNSANKHRHLRESLRHAVFVDTLATHMVKVTVPCSRVML